MRKFEFKQIIPGNIDSVWDFFSSPKNLSKITPTGMSFEITSMPDGEMYPGMFISYKVKPILGIKMNWVTEITHVENKRFFIDEQRVGPYSIWHHEHHFNETENGVLMHDILYYRIPFGILGEIVDFLFVKQKVSRIFEFRKNAISGLFKK
jgi:ligand-binding SRPBCC domain-containing protein